MVNLGFADRGEFWRAAYEDETFESQVENLFRQLLPLYEQMHAYVRNKLRAKYPAKLTKFTIPAHLLGKHSFSL